MFPVDPMMIGALFAPLGLAAGPVVPAREWRELYAALDCGAVAAIHPFYTAVIREFEAAGRPIIGSAPVGRDGTAAWLKNIGEAFGIGTDKVAAAQNMFLPAIKSALENAPVKGRITLSGYEGSELLVARLLTEAVLRFLCRHGLSQNGMVGGRCRMAAGARNRSEIPCIP